MTDGSDATGARELFDDAFRRRLEVLRDVVARALAGRGGAGRSALLERGGRVEFAGHREYVAGDDPRTIDWNAYARLGALVVKEFEAPREAHLLLVLDRSGSMRCFEKDRHALRLAAAIGWLGLRAGARVACVSAVAASPWIQSVERFPQLLDALRRMPEQQEAEVSRAVERAPTHGVGPRTAVVLSDAYELEDASRAVTALRRGGGAATWVQVTAPAERRAPDGVAVELVDAETGDVQQIPLTTAVISEYTRRVAAFRADVRAMGLRHGASVVDADAGADLLESVEAVLGRGGER